MILNLIKKIENIEKIKKTISKLIAPSAQGASTALEKGGTAGYCAGYIVS